MTGPAAEFLTGLKYDDAPTLSLDVDQRTRLNDLMTAARIRGAHFGKEVQLTEQDRQTLRIVHEWLSATVSRWKSLHETQWREFQMLITEGSEKGVLMSLSTHPNTFVPTWCQDGGANATIAKQRKQTESGVRNSIVVPSEIFNLLHWQKVAEGLLEYIESTSEALNGRSSKFLGEYLRHLAILKEILV